MFMLPPIKKKFGACPARNPLRGLLPDEKMAYLFAKQKKDENAYDAALCVDTGRTFPCSQSYPGEEIVGYPVIGDPPVVSLVVVAEGKSPHNSGKSINEAAEDAEDDMMVDKEPSGSKSPIAAADSASMSLSLPARTLASRLPRPVVDGALVEPRPRRIWPGRA